MITREIEYFDRNIKKRGAKETREDIGRQARSKIEDSGGGKISKYQTNPIARERKQNGPESAMLR